MATTRHQNHGLRKVCGCARRKWAKCSHPWHVNLQINGVHVRKSVNKLAGKPITSKTDAERELAKLTIRLQETGAADPEEATLPALTLSRLLTEYQTTVLSRKPTADNTQTQINAISRVALPKGETALAFGEWPVTDVDTAALWAYRAARDVKQVTTSLSKHGKTVRRVVGGAIGTNRDLSLLRRAFNWGRTALPHQVKVSPFTGLLKGQKLFAKESARSRRLQGDEADRLLAAAGTSLRPIVEVALETAMRRGEILGLQWADVTLDGAKPHITLPADKTKTSAPRSIPISARLKPILEMRRSDADGEPHPADAYVFGHAETGERMASIKTAWTGALRAATITGLHFHDLRREAASRWLDAGVRLTVISKWLGHTTTEQTATYLACALNADHDSMAAVDAFHVAEQQRREAEAIRKRAEAEARLQLLASQAGTGVHTTGDESTTRDTSPLESSTNPVIH